MSVFRMKQRARQYEKAWRTRGYPAGLPDEVPVLLQRERLAPSWKAVAMSILNNDHNMHSLGFTPKPSSWYAAIKRAEKQRDGVEESA